MEAATVWKWLLRLVRYYVYFISIVWLMSALLLLYLMHAPASSIPAPLTHPASSSSSTATTSGPYRLHSLMIASTTTMHTNMRALLNGTRTTSDRLFRHPSPLHPLTSHLAEAVDGAVSVLEGVADGACMLMKELADEWLSQTVEMMEDLRERHNHPHTGSTRSLPWQQQQLDVGGDGRAGAAQEGQQQHKQQHRQQTAEGGKPAGGESTTAAGGHRHSSTPPRPSRGSDVSTRPSLTITSPIQSTHRSLLPDGSVLYLSPLPSDDAAFSLDSVAALTGGVEGEQRVALSLKDGLVRVTRKGQGEERNELLVHQLRGGSGEKADEAAAAA